MNSYNVLYNILLIFFIIIFTFFIKNLIKFYKNSLSKKDQEIKEDLIKALFEDEFDVYYQPIIDITSNKIISAEALLRWNSPNAVKLSPTELIEKIEQLELMNPIGNYVLKEAIKQAKEWNKLNLGKISVAVNVSTAQINSDTFEWVILNLLDDFNYDGILLELELTEKLVIHNLDKIRDMLNTLKSLGIKISIDDFSMGYSSLQRIKQLPIDQLKIDKSFIDDININDPYFDNIMLLAKSLKIYTIAEGVETEEQLNLIKLKGCDSYQGFKCSKPVPIDQFIKLLYRINGEENEVS